jgi:hypothetical protein
MNGEEQKNKTSLYPTPGNIPARYSADLTDFKALERLTSIAESWGFKMEGCASLGIFIVVILEDTPSFTGFPFSSFVSSFFMFFLCLFVF